jgi:hypothetical protein
MMPASARAEPRGYPGRRSSRLNCHRAGLAAIEFVMALTVILFLLVALMWIGRVAVNSVQASVAARHDAWTRRPQAQPRSFDFTDLEGGRVHGAATAPVSVSPLFDGWILPRAEQTIVGGSWDHRRERLSHSPNRRLYPVLLRNTLASGAAGLTDLEGAMASFAGRVTAGIGNDQMAEAVRHDEESRRGAEEQIRQQLKQQQAQANEAWNQEIEKSIRDINAQKDSERQKVAKIDRDLADIDRAISEHAATEPKDDRHRERMRHLERQRENLRQQRREPAERIRKLEELEADARGQTIR